MNRLPALPTRGAMCIACLALALAIMMGLLLPSPARASSPSTPDVAHGR